MTRVFGMALWVLLAPFAMVAADLRFDVVPSTVPTTGMGPPGSPRNLDFEQ